MAKNKPTNAQLNFTQGSGYIYIGSLLIQWGSTTTASVGAGAYAEVSTAITFPVAFSTTPVFTVTPSDFANACGEYTSIGALSASGATVWCGHVGASVAATNALKWIAIGAA